MKSALKKGLILILLLAIVVLVAVLGAQIATVEPASGLGSIASDTTSLEGGDLYAVKFPVTISLLLIALAIFSVWLLLRSGFLKVKNKKK